MTPTPPPLDLAALRVIAEVATEGPWRIYTVTDSGGRSAAVETAWAHDEQGEDTELVTDWCSPEDAAHIAAFDPPTVLHLIETVEYEREATNGFCADRNQWRARAEVAEAKIAAVRELHAASPCEPDCCLLETCNECLNTYPCPTIAALDTHTPETETT